jgi:hypothetical protein
MAKITVYQCDQCKHLSNDLQEPWFFVERATERSISVELFYVQDLGPAILSNAHRASYCGKSCALQALSELMNKLNGGVSDREEGP